MNCVKIIEWSKFGLLMIVLYIDHVMLHMRMYQCCQINYSASSCTYSGTCIIRYPLDMKYVSDYEIQFTLDYAERVKNQCRTMEVFWITQVLDNAWFHYAFNVHVIQQ